MSVCYCCVLTNAPGTSTQMDTVLGPRGDQASDWPESEGLGANGFRSLSFSVGAGASTHGVASARSCPLLDCWQECRMQLQIARDRAGTAWPCHRSIVNQLAKVHVQTSEMYLL